MFAKKLIAVVRIDPGIFGYQKKKKFQMYLNVFYSEKC